MIFLLVQHPFDVGDTLNLNGELYIVNAIALTHCVMLTREGKKVCLILAPA
jgi:hypothetical protein